MADVIMGQNDRQPPLLFSLRNPDGTPVNLSGTGTAVNFVMSPIGTTLAAPVVNAACQILDPLNGLVQYNWAVGNTGTLGTFIGQFRITFPDGTVQHVPRERFFTVQIVPNLA